MKLILLIECIWITICAETLRHHVLILYIHIGAIIEFLKLECLQIVAIYCVGKAYLIAWDHACSERALVCLIIWNVDRWNIGISLILLSDLLWKLILILLAYIICLDILSLDMSAMNIITLKFVAAYLSFIRVQSFLSVGAACCRYVDWMRYRGHELLLLYWIIRHLVKIILKYLPIVLSILWLINIMSWHLGHTVKW